MFENIEPLMNPSLFRSVPVKEPVMEAPPSKPV
jgi:hypothetical protein